MEYVYTNCQKYIEDLVGVSLSHSRALSFVLFLANELRFPQKWPTILNKNRWHNDTCPELLQLIPYGLSTCAVCCFCCRLVSNFFSNFQICSSDYFCQATVAPFYFCEKCNFRIHPSCATESLQDGMFPGSTLSYFGPKMISSLWYLFWLLGTDSVFNFLINPIVNEVTVKSKSYVAPDLKYDPRGQPICCKIKLEGFFAFILC
jgi:hypothetical protein